MSCFVLLKVIGREGATSSRVFNLRYIKAFEPSSCTVLLYGNKRPFLVTQDSIDALMQATIREDGLI